MGKNLTAEICIHCNKNLVYYGAKICNKCNFEMDKDYYIKQWRDEMQRQMVEIEEK